MTYKESCRSIPFNKILANRILKRSFTMTQVGFIPGKKELFDICKSIKVTHHINRMKEENHIIILIIAEMGFGHSTFLHYKNSEQFRCRSHTPQHNKAMHRESRADTTLKAFSPWDLEQDRMSTFTTFLTLCWKS
jgi:hypothetical protein